MDTKKLNIQKTFPKAVPKAIPKAVPKTINPPIDFNDFDTVFYLATNVDLVPNGIITPQQAYLHWINYGTYENRKVKNLKTGEIHEFKIGNNIKYNSNIQTKIQNNTRITGPKQIIQKDHNDNRVIDDKNINFKIAIMLYIFNMTLAHCFKKSKIDLLIDKYGEDNVHLYIALPISDNPTIDDGLNINDHIKKLYPYKNVFIHILGEYNYLDYKYHNGGDIGGLVFLSKCVTTQMDENNIKYKWCIFLHTKTNDEWRNELCKGIFNINYNKLTDNIGLIGSNKWLLIFNSQKNKNYSYHLDNLCKIYEINLNNNPIWKFVGGTIFIANISIIQKISQYEYLTYSILNSPISSDNNWISKMEKLGKDRLGCHNDYEYRLKYNKTLLSDFMVEHTFERFIGLISKNLNLKNVGINEFLYLK